MSGDVIERLMAAEGGSRELDCMIEKLLGEKSLCTQDAPMEILLAPHTFGISGVAEWCDGTEEVFQYLPETNADGMGIPNYTTNVDAALTLVPDGWDFVECNSNGNRWFVVLGDGDHCHPKYREAWSWPGGERDRAIFHRKPFALAICLVALRTKDPTHG